MTKQEVFDRVWDHFVTQGNPPSRATARSQTMSECRYRGPNGEKCAVGIFIPDDKYDPEMEAGHTAVSRVIREALPKDVRPHCDFLRHLQSVHDQNAMALRPFREGIERDLRAIAQGHGLQVPA